MINKKNVKDSKVKDLLKFKRGIGANEFLQKRKFYDTTIETKSNKREKKKSGAFNFIKEGT